VQPSRFAGYLSGQDGREHVFEGPEGPEDQRVAREVVMALRMTCMCGYVIEGEDDDEFWTNARGHMGVLHPELVGNVSREDILAQAERL
jgi:hypothetical protein